MTNFRKLTDNDDIQRISTWIYLTDSFTFDKVFLNKENAIGAIGLLINSKYINPYHRKFITIVYDTNPETIIAVAVAFKGSDITFKDTFKAFVEIDSTPISRVVLYEVLGVIFASYIRNNDYYLGNLYVDESYRNKSIGSKLVEKIKQKARQCNCGNLLLDVEYNKQSLLSFYEKLGFEKNSRNYHRFIGKTYGCYGMRYKIK